MFLSTIETITESRQVPIPASLVQDPLRPHLRLVIAYQNEHLVKLMTLQLSPIYGGVLTEHRLVIPPNPVVHGPPSAPL